jgi:hypothetical protein
MYYKLIPNASKSETIIIQKDFASKNSLSEGQEIILQAGVKSKSVVVSIINNSASNTIEFSQPILDYFPLPTSPRYQIEKESNILHIGPVIGILLTRTSKQLTPKALEKCLDYAFYYKNFNGLLCLFSFEGINFEGINFESSTVEGYYFDLSQGENRGIWKKGVFPLPSAIYRRLSLKAAERTRLRKATSDRLFNSFYFNKLTFSELISSSKIINSHIPDTRFLNSLDDIKTMLKLYGTVYLKLVNGSKSLGLIQVTKNENYCFRKNAPPYSEIIENDKDASNYINSIKKRGNYLVQQAITPLKLEGRTVDFRVVMQKNEDLCWDCTAILSKVGQVASICSNFWENGYTLYFEDALAATTDLSQDEITNKKNELINVCKILCLEMDNIGETFGDFAIDIVLDKNLNIWILEINKEQDFNILLNSYSRKEYLSIRSNVTRYALGLTNFTIIKD